MCLLLSLRYWHPTSPSHAKLAREAMHFLAAEALGLKRISEGRFIGRDQVTEYLTLGFPLKLMMLLGILRLLRAVILNYDHSCFDTTPQEPFSLGSSGMGERCLIQNPRTVFKRADIFFSKRLDLTGVNSNICVSVLREFCHFLNLVL